MNYVKLTGTKLKQESPEGVQDFLDNHVIAICNWMQDEQEHPVLPFFVHAIQLGLEYNIIVDMRNKAKPGIIINPRVEVRDSKHIQEGIEASPNLLNEDESQRRFYTERSTECLAIMDDYFGVDKPFKRNSEVLTEYEAVFYQQLVDLSEGKLLTRFPEIKLEDQEEC